MPSYHHRRYARRRRRWAAGGLLPVLFVLTLLAPPATATESAAAPRVGPQRMYANPVARGTADDFPDPSVIRGRDGYWYAYSTRTRLVQGGTTLHHLPVMRTRDLVAWDYVGDAFDESNWPSWLDEGSTIWGPAIEFIDGRYVLYFVGVNVPGYDKPNKALGVATAPTPAGPWTASDAPLIAPQFYQRPPHNRVNERALIAPDGVQAADGRRYLYYGGFNGGVWGVSMSDDGLTVAGDAVRLVDDAHFEGPYVLRRDGWYYMFVSANHCCLGGPVAGYTGWVVRSRNPLGPFVDRQGLPAHGTYPGGTPVSFANGNQWVSPGVNSLTTDIAGQDWMVYHAVDREHPYLNGPFQGGLQRGLFIDRLDWIDGWPTVRAGRGPSQGPTAAPAAQASVLADPFESGQINTETWTEPAGWRVEKETAGGYVRTDAEGGEEALWARKPWSADTVVRASVRTPRSNQPGAVGLRLADWGGAITAGATVNSATGALDVTVTDAGKPAVTTSRALPATFDSAGWHELAAELSQGELRVRLADVAADHPVADVRVALPAGLVAGKVGLLARGTVADVDDVTVTGAAAPTGDLAADPEAGQVDPELSDEFTDQPGAQWSWVREPKAQVRDGALEFPVQQGNIMGANENASLLTRPVPVDQAWIVETKLDLDVGDAPLWGFPIAGLVTYTGDDEFVMNVVHGRNVVRDARMVRETVYADRRVTGNAMTGAAGQPDTWLRLHHSIDPDTGEHHLRGAASIDGENWTWVTTYTMPAGTGFTVGLIAAGASPDDPAFTARFDYLRILRP